MIEVKPDYADIAYASQSEAETLDIYLPNRGRRPLPVIVFIHGGAWCMGDKRDWQSRPFLTLVDAGYAVASINYRLIYDGDFPASITDCKAAVRFLKANAARYQLDPERIGLAGDSTGGNLVLMLGTTEDHPELMDLSLGYPEQDTRVRCIVSWYAPTDIGKMYEQLRESGLNYISEDDPTTYEARYLGGSIRSLPDEKLRLASPIYHIHEDMPPILLQHGIRDNLVPCQQAETFYEQAVPIVGKDQITLELFENAGHADAKFETTKNMARVRAFFDQYLK